MNQSRRGHWFSAPWEKKYFQLAASIDVTGGTFASTLRSTVFETSDSNVSGRGFSQSAKIFSGTDVNGGSFSTDFSSTVLSNNEAFVTGGSFTTTPTITAQGHIDVNVTGGAFSTELSAHLGAETEGRGFNTDLTTVINTSTLTTVDGRGFTQSVIISAIGNESANLTGRGFSSGLFYSSVTGRGFNSLPIISVDNATFQDNAFVMNVHTTDVTRYTNYEFMHIIHIGGKPYGVKSDGLYLLEGASDAGTEINGTVITKDTDFGAYQSKNVAYAYLNSDEPINITPFVDDVKTNTYTSQFAGRKVKLGRGSKGRYWQFKIESIARLEGIEILPQPLQRRVK